MISIKKINNEVVKPIIVHGKGFEVDKRPIKGEKLFSELYANIFICAKKKSGKSVLAGKIIKDCADKNTTVLVFCSTLDKDINHKKIKIMCKNKGIPYCGYTSLMDENVDILDELMKKLQQEAEPEDSDTDEEPEEQQLNLFNDYDSENDEPKKRKAKYQVPEYIIFIDDLSNELKSPTIIKLMKANRHYKCKLIISSQFVHDLRPESIKQLDFMIMFKSMSTEKLEKIYKDLDLSVDFNTFITMYKDSTKEKFNFFYIDVRNDEFRKNFTHKYDCLES